MYKKEITKNKNIQFIFLFIIFLSVTQSYAFADQTFFDLSDEKIEIRTNFTGKEIVIFGLTNPYLDTILTIKGPGQDTKVSKKERLFGFWFNTKKIIYKNLPNIFFIASSSPIKEILNIETIIKKSLDFEQMINNIITQRDFNFNEKNKFEIWNKEMINIKKDLQLYKEYKLEIIDDRLFQAKIFFPIKSVPGDYEVKIYQINNKIIVSEKTKNITIKKTGLGNFIYNFANDQSAAYGILCIIIAVLAGLIAATVFRRV